MSNVNDAKILELKAQIKEKKAKLKSVKKFSPVTNCSIELDGIRSNLQVLTKELLTSLLVKLNMYRLSISDLGLSEYNISGFKVEDWITDIRSKLDIIAYREEESKLQELENKLHILLSNDKKVELEINEIESLLKWYNEN